MSHVSSQKAVEMVGNRFDLVLIASIRARELKKNYRPQVITDGDGPILTALKEIENGEIGRDYLKRIK